ncbi:hypothetical protein R69658_07726 [Paraburkholderia aspalathi]|uniref:Uncharacterized protein n=1 Tax=Paraburkholderia aspalathi TaxID=1324617 RepID=A0ABN7N935_9BURK|nr:hypothetical protein [Paraburkholderia aspalathi]MBK3824021.1 hypothetical protein [Paraburkholderia aspalathi]MBK3835863.1 hypothetical protein [Paraburkholderia aspalathi]MBK3865640.1 hypothetical protein [Paraburkholderia aspalathi]CAE6863397.1 hypothetical protein R69658_07726 [Paraburkholderia aspalathi]
MAAATKGTLAGETVEGLDQVLDAIGRKYHARMRTVDAPPASVVACPVTICYGHTLPRSLDSDKAQVTSVQSLTNISIGRFCVYQVRIFRVTSHIFPCYFTYLRQPFESFPGAPSSRETKHPVKP